MKRCLLFAFVLCLANFMGAIEDRSNNNSNFKKIEPRSYFWSVGSFRYYEIDPISQEAAQYLDIMNILGNDSSSE